MMTIEQFVEKYNGKRVEVAGSTRAENQCVDLANAYIRDVLGLPIITGADAKDFPTRASDEDYDWVAYDGQNVPVYGAIVIWGTGVGASGHIDVCVDRNAARSAFQGFDQNWPLGSVCRPVNHNYTNVLGWLIPKNNDDMTTEEKQMLNEVHAFMQDVKAGCKALRQRASDGALFADADVLGKPAETLRRTIWADSQALAILMRGAGVPQINEEESKKDKYVRVQSARQFDDKK